MIELGQKRKVCANCGNSYRENEKYCRYCGAPMGTPDYIEEEFACIYGPPPVSRTHKCEKCGFTWKTTLMIDDEKFCPECGGPAPVVASEE
ncbi:MAG: zinc-ribbon domain-containing protein [Mogibacterium sp.]|nr:zinc-ribbon domain-containing protein [Mogibacterium sp.]